MGLCSPLYSSLATIRDRYLYLSLVSLVLYPYRVISHPYNQVALSTYTRYVDEDRSRNVKTRKNIFISQNFATDPKTSQH